MRANRKIAPGKLPARHFKKTVLFHLEQALKAAEDLVERDSLEGNQNIRKGLEIFIHNVKAK